MQYAAPPISLYMPLYCPCAASFKSACMSAGQLLLHHAHCNAMPANASDDQVIKT